MPTENPHYQPGWRRRYAKAKREVKRLNQQIDLLRAKGLSGVFREQIDNLNDQWKDACLKAINAERSRFRTIQDYAGFLIEKYCKDSYVNPVLLDKLTTSEEAESFVVRLLKDKDLDHLQRKPN